MNKRLTTFLCSLFALLLAFALPALILSACDKSDPQGCNITVYFTKTDNTCEMSFDDFLVGCVAAITDPSIDYPDEAMRAICLAVESRLLYLCGRCSHTADKSVDFCDSADDGTGYLSPEEAADEYGKAVADAFFGKISSTVSTVIGLSICYDGAVALALTHKSSYLLTENAEAVCGKDYPYLRSVRSYEAKQEELTRVSDDILKALVKGRYETDTTALEITARTPAGRVAKVSLGEKEISGTDFAGLLGIPSTDFTIEHSGNEYLFKSLGEGNGLGMSHMGAIALALDGQGAEAIVAAYYPGVTIEKTDIAAILKRSRG